MAIPIIQAIPSILSIVFCTIILIMLTMNYLANKFVPTLLFLIFFLGIDLWSVTKLVSVFLPENANSTFILIWKISSLSILIVSLLVICFFRDLMVYSLPAFPSLIATFLSGITLGTLWFGNYVTVEFSSKSGWNTNYEVLFLAILLFYLLIVYLLMFIMLFSGLRKATNKKQRTQLILLIVGMAIAAIGGTIANYLLNLIEALQDKGDFDVILVVIGFSIVTWAYLKSPTQIYYAPVSAYQLFVIHSSGVPLFTHEFRKLDQEGPTLDHSLISGGLSGITDFLKECLLTESPPRIIQQGDLVILLERIEAAFCALITNSDSMVLRAALKDFAREFEYDYGDAVATFDGIVDVFNGASELVNEDFPFLLKEEIKEG